MEQIHAGAGAGLSGLLAIQLCVQCRQLFYLFKRRGLWRNLKAQPPDPAAGIMCAILGITAQSLASVLNVPVLFIFNKISGRAAVTAPVNITQLLWGFLLVSMLPAIFEELLMRGIVLSATQENGYRASLIIGGLYFALIHNQAESIVGHFFLGFLLCYIVWMTQSIWGGVIAHFSFNAFGMTLDYIIKTKSEHWLGADFFHHTVTVVSIILFFLFWGTINRKRIRR